MQPKLNPGNQVTQVHDLNPGNLVTRVQALLPLERKLAHMRPSMRGVAYARGTI